MHLTTKMKTITKIGLFSLGCMLASTQLSIAANLFTADNKNFQYTGRVDFSQKHKPMISWPGTSIKTKFTGSYLAITLEDEKGENYFSVIVDDEIYHPYVIEAKKGKHEYVIAQDLSSGEHTLEIYKRTEGEQGGSYFYGISVDGELKQPAPRPQRKIAFFGDSITTGMGNEAADNGADHLNSEKNNYWSYSSITARALNAEQHTVSQSGIGIMISWFDFIMPQFYDQLSAVGNNDSQWDFSQWQPDVVVINLFQNDSWLIDREKRLKPQPTEQDIIDAYTQFISKIYAEYPNAYFICALGSMDATREGSKWPGYVKQAVEQFKQQKKYKRIDTLTFDFNGYWAHPRVHQHKTNAAKLTKFIQQKMAW